HDDPVKARAELLGAGWLDALDADEVVAVALVFREQGRTARDVAALDDVLGHRLGVADVAVAYPAAPGMQVVLPAHHGAPHVLWVPDLVVIELDEPLGGAPVRGIDP